MDKKGAEVVVEVHGLDDVFKNPMEQVITFDPWGKTKIPLLYPARKLIRTGCRLESGDDDPVLVDISIRGEDQKILDLFFTVSAELDDDIVPMQELSTCKFINGVCMYLYFLKFSDKRRMK